MRCPMKYNNDSSLASQKCIKEECAWYIKYRECCAVSALAESITDVAEGQRTIYTREI